MTFKTGFTVRGGSRRVSKGLDFFKLPYVLYVFIQTSLSKQCRPRSNAAEHGVWSHSTLFTTQPAILHTFTGSNMDRSIRKSIPNSSNLSKISHENETFSLSTEPYEPPSTSTADCSCICLFFFYFVTKIRVWSLFYEKLMIVNFLITASLFGSLQYTSWLSIKLRRRPN